jgi:hypothetical protein
MTERKEDWIEANHLKYNVQLGNTLAYVGVAANRTKMGIGTGSPYAKVVEDFIAEAAPYSSKFSDWEPEHKRTDIITSDFLEAEKRMKKAHRALYAFLKSSPLVDDHDLISMSMPKRPTGERHPSPVASEAPVITLSTSSKNPGVVTVHYTPGDDGKNKAKPDGQHGIEARILVVDAGLDRLPPEPAELVDGSYFDTRTPLEMDLNDKGRGRRVYVAARWENNVGAKGPFSLVHFIIIP